MFRRETSVWDQGKLATCLVNISVLANRFDGVLTGKSELWGGSQVRKEATGYGVVYFAQCMMDDQDDSLDGKRCLISGSGNVAIHAMEAV